MTFDIKKKIKGKNKEPIPQEINIIVSEHVGATSCSIPITPKLASEGEVDYYINSLIRELESVREKAKKALS